MVKYIPYTSTRFSSFENIRTFLLFDVKRTATKTWERNVAQILSSKGRGKFDNELNSIRSDLQSPTIAIETSCLQTKYGFTFPNITTLCMS